MSLSALFEQIHKLPSIPAVVQELIDNFNNPDVDADAISANIRKDQVISAKVMRLANSARYGAGRKIASIDTAVVMRGFDTLKTLVIASGVTSAFPQIPGFDLKEFWKHSLSVAGLSKSLAKHATDLDAEEAFTCGLLHNIGEALIHIGESDVEREIDRLVQGGESRIELQRNKFGFDYTGVGEELARRWNFPSVILQGIRQHATPTQFEEFSKLAGVVYLSRFIVRQLEAGADDETMREKMPLTTIEKLGLNVDQVIEVANAFAEEDDDLDAILG